MCRKCGLVNFSALKNHIVLQALSSLQAYTDNLRIYNDNGNGTVEAQDVEGLLPLKQ